MVMKHEIELNGKEVSTLPEITINGQQVIMTPEVKEIYELINMANTAKIRKLLEDQASEGWTQTFILNINDTEPSQEFVLSRPAQSMALINAGPGQMIVSINSRGGSPTPVAALQPYNVSFTGHKLMRFFIVCPSGTVAAGVAVTKG